MSTQADLIVIGSGILGLATAHRAHRAGLRVHVIDESERPVSSSIQNFGHACFTGQADAFQDLADVSRAGWLQASEDSGLWAAESGTLVPAQTAAEMRVLEELSAHRGAEQVRLLSTGEIRARLSNPYLDTVGGALLPRDMRVDPREAAPRLACWLESRGVVFHRGERVLRTSGGLVETSRARHRAERVVACPGLGLPHLFPEVAQRIAMTQCTLSMLLVERPSHLSRELAMLSGTSLARYDGFTAMPGAAALREELARREPELVACTANLMATATAQGLLIGDSHAYDASPEPFLHEEVSALLLDRASRLLGLRSPRILQRWQGRYADAPGMSLLIERPDEATTIAVVTSGIGMTLSFGIAELVLAGGDSPDAADRPRTAVPALVSAR
ncbi:TIGR03364 family FAD-dependent oxidoreductase [Brachybacterium hainanense]|uniref:TIGR03364 family FAD-dependent oxidoreductase n=1 Tax=Brachybacterium hainanense TaxID=1541174 RepID=A0ABV6RE97_9MICO